MYIRTLRTKRISGAYVSELDKIDYSSGGRMPSNIITPYGIYPARLLFVPKTRSFKAVYEALKQRSMAVKYLKHQLPALNILRPFGAVIVAHNGAKFALLQVQPVRDESSSVIYTRDDIENVINAIRGI